RYLADEPIRARRIGPVERLGRWGRRNPLVASLTAAVVLVAALGFAGVVGQMQEAKKERDEVKALNEKLLATQEQLRRILYTAHMNLAQRAWDDADVQRVLSLLDQHRPKPKESDLRSFEWHYLNLLCHADVPLLSFQTDGFVKGFSIDGKRLI